MLGRFDDMKIEEPASKSTIDRTLFGIFQECFDNISPDLTPNINHSQFVKQYLKKLVLWQFDSFRHYYIEEYEKCLTELFKNNGIIVGNENGTTVYHHLSSSGQEICFDSSP